MVSNELKSQLQHILQSNDKLLSYILDFTNNISNLTINNSNEIIELASEIRGQLVQAMDGCNHMFETNIQCFSQILSIKKENAKLQEDLENLKKNNEDRINSLLELIENQQREINNYQTRLSINSIWNNLLTNYTNYSNNYDVNNKSLLINDKSTNSSNIASTTLTYLSTIITNELINNNHNIENNLLMNILNTVNQISNQLNIQIYKLENENNNLRDVIHEKSIDIESYKRNETQVHEIFQDIENKSNNIGHTVNDLQEQLANNHQLNNQLKEKINQLQQQLTIQQCNYDQLVLQYEESTTICNNWKITCQNYQRMLNTSSYSPIAKSNTINSPIPDVVKFDKDENHNYHDLFKYDDLNNHSNNFQSPLNIQNIPIVTPATPTVATTRNVASSHMKDNIKQMTPHRSNSKNNHIFNNKEKLIQYSIKNTPIRKQSIDNKILDKSIKNRDSPIDIKMGRNEGKKANKSDRKITHDDIIDFDNLDISYTSSEYSEVQAAVALIDAILPWDN